MPVASISSIVSIFVTPTMAAAAMVGRGRPKIVPQPIGCSVRPDDLDVNNISGRREKIQPWGASQLHLKVGVKSITFACFRRYRSKWGDREEDRGGGRA